MRGIPVATVAALLWASLAASVAPLQVAASTWNWYKTDTHVHSTVSGDGIDDIGIISAAAKARGYDVMFMTDHQAGSNFPISTVVANHVVFDDDLGTKWKPDTYGSLSSSTNALVTSPVQNGTKSMHLQASSSTSGEAFTYIKRGPNLRSGPDILDFWVYPTRLDANSGVYVSASIGGDPSVQGPDGYTTTDGVIHPGRSTIFAWQLGSPRVVSTDPEARVVVEQLPAATLNTWNHYTIDVTADIAAALNGSSTTTPLDYNSLTQIKISAMGRNGGTADAYFDNLHIDATGSIPSGDEFVYRNNAIHSFDTSTFKIYPSIEMGFNRHAQRFNFGITTAAQYNSFFGCNSSGASCTITRGIDGIAPTQATGYPAQLNHPGLPGGVSQTEAISTNGEGADVMEVRDQTMINSWEPILQGGYVLPGTWSSDMHKIATLDVSGRGAATYVYSPTIGFDDLMRSIFEGRMYLAGHSFTGRVLFNLDDASQEPYPARYPVRVDPSQTTRNVHLKITGGLATGEKVVWIRNGVVLATDAISGSSYELTRQVPLSGSMTYIRAEVQDASGNRLAMTEPIFFMDDGTLPAGMSHRIDAVTTANGQGYNRTMVKGITASGWNGTSQSLSLTIDDGANALTSLSVTAGSFTPQAVKLDGTPLPASATQAIFDASTTSTWFYDAGVHRVYVKAKPTNSSAVVLIEFGGTPDSTPPSVPGNVAAAAVSGTQVNLSWSASTDNVSVAGYTIYRDSVSLGTVPGGTLTYSDSSVSPGTTYSYTLDAFDAAGNHSTQSTPAATATTPTVTSLTVTPLADSYVDGSKSGSNFGSATTLRVDASPDVRSYLRFDLSGVSGTITKLTLRIWANSGQSSGWQAKPVSGTWTESGLTFANAPSLGASVGGSGKTIAGSWSSADVTALLNGGTTLDIGLSTPSTTALSLASRESGASTAPQLVIETN